MSVLTRSEVGAHERPSALTRGWQWLMRSSWAGRLLFPVVCLLFWLAAIKAVTTIWPFAVDVLPTPWQVFGFMADELRGDTLAPHNMYVTFGISLQRLGIGMLIAMVIGTVIGIAMGLSKAVDAFFNDWVVAILAMPNLAWALFCSLAFGFGDVGPIVTVVLTGVPFVIINVREGVRNTPTDLYDMARAFGVPRDRVIRHVLIPSLLPFLFAAARYCFALGWKGLVVAEVFGGQDGAGWTIKFWYDAHRAYGVVGYALLFVIFALIFEKFMFDQLSKRLFKWRPAIDAVDVVEERFDAPAQAAVAAAETGATTTSAALGSITLVTQGPNDDQPPSTAPGAPDNDRRNDRG
ncbi:ABC transporter permease [Mycolicibacterium smegmatis]|uniref:ABC nitrate/sulfonate/bicarbonate family protein transporter, inner membrane subunit, putative n=1 Tax=Mycolicibacterium smegmatis (strain MKD8) TaxID=1214915 RepID=A0A2U9PUJ2_MYCSE|nr:ABC transporter permease [Mycolicibacterium smegmatis]AWT55408.1 ABC nitrate/sulfonate/bicarbonate family protein transporter, inner membrane subunit, putative [Mycolicibacterium smegmatis MKD8]UGU33504.1 ABC transporter permease [Mycolicibacterium smegmatis]ULN33303.1 ABC transporter permease [Mycolicibacterium smegmatis]ULN68368.1 ABC transporter permease [Mycolicibacterium smegmatis]